MTDARSSIPTLPARAGRPTLAAVGACAAIVLLWAAFFWRPLAGPGPDRLMLIRSPAVLGAHAARSAALTRWNSTGDVCTVGPDARSLAYPPAIAAVAAHAATGAQSFPFRSLEWEVMLHALLAAVGAFAWQRARPLGPAAAVAGAAAYTFGAFGAGYALSRPDALAAISWLPWGLWCARRAAGSGAPVWPIGAATCGALAMLSGDLALGATAAAVIACNLAVARPRPTLSHAATAALFVALASPALVAGSSALVPWPESRGWASVVPGAGVVFFGLMSPRPRRVFGVGIAVVAATLALDAARVARDALPALALLANTALASAAAAGVHASAIAAGFRARRSLGRAARAGAMAAVAAFSVVVVSAVFIRLDIPPVAALDAEANRLALMALVLAACALLARWRATSPRLPPVWTALAAGLLVFEAFSAQHFGGMDAVGEVPAPPPVALVCSSAQAVTWAIGLAAAGLAVVWTVVGGRRR